MREIKFRAWDKKNKIMVCSDDENQGYGWFTGNDGCMLCVRIEEERDIKLNNIMQYTGLKDKKRKEIYEGDICKSTRGYDFIVNWEESTVRFLGKVITKTQERYCCHVDEVDKNGEVSVEVIGNIYENPELLEAR